MSDKVIYTVIAGMALLNFGMRVSPLVALSGRRLPKPLMRWLSFIPVSVMGALVSLEVLRPGGEWQPVLGNPGVYAAALTMLVFRFSRSFLGATLTGMLSYVVLGALFR